METTSSDRQKLEAMIVATILEELKHKEITGDRAVEIARQILKMIPEDITDQKLIDTLPEIGKQIGELAGVVHDLLLEHDEKMKANALPKIRQLITENIKK